MEATFTVELKNKIAGVTLAGRLDAVSAPAFEAEIRTLIGQEVDSFVLFAKDLEYISSAGLRVIIFAKQKLGAQTKVYLIAAQEPVLNVIRMSGVDSFIIIQDEFRP